MKFSDTEVEQPHTSKKKPQTPQFHVFPLRQFSVHMDMSNLISKTK